MEGSDWRDQTGGIKLGGVGLGGRTGAGLSNWTSSRLPDVGDVVRSRTSGCPVRRSVRGVKLHLYGGCGENFTPLDFYADDVAT